MKNIFSIIVIMLLSCSLIAQSTKGRFEKSTTNTTSGGGAADGVVTGATVNPVTNELELTVTGGNNISTPLPDWLLFETDSSAFVNISDGSFTLDQTVTAYRTGNTGFNESNPTRQVDIKGTLSVNDDNNNVFTEGGVIGATGANNAAYGANSLISITNQNENTAFGSNSLRNNISSGHTAFGYNALLNNTTGYRNTAVGHRSQENSLTGGANTSVGALTLNNSIGFNNTAIGDRAATANVTGSQIVAVGGLSLFSNTTGSDNLAVGYQSLFLNNVGDRNIGVGLQALRSNTSGSDNMALGQLSMFSNLTGSFNTAVGSNSMYRNTGSENVAVGQAVMFEKVAGDGNTVVGYASMNAWTFGTDNTAIGKRALGSSAGSQINLNNTTALGAYAIPNQSNMIVLGANPALSLFSGTAPELIYSETESLIFPFAKKMQVELQTIVPTSIADNTTIADAEVGTIIYASNGDIWVKISEVGIIP